MDLSQVQSAAETIVAVSAIGAGVWKWRPLVAWLLAWFSMPQRVATLDTIVKKELRPNGGSSTLDLVKKTADQMAILESRFGLAEARHQATLAQLDACCWESDSKGYCVRVTRAMLRLVERTQEETLGLGWVSSICEDQREVVVAEWFACVRDGRDFAMEYTFVTPRGVEVNVHAEATVIRDIRGNVAGFVGRCEKKEPS